MAESLHALFKLKIEAQIELQELEKRYKYQKKKIEDEIANANERIQMHSASLDTEKIDLAESIIKIRGTYLGNGDRPQGDRPSCVLDAICQFATGEVPERNKDIWKQYFGVKDYAQWRGQRADTEYGMKPKHGNIVFAIELREEVRKNRSYEDLAEEEIEAVLYYLNNLKTIEKSRNQAAKA